MGAINTEEAIKTAKHERPKKKLVEMANAARGNHIQPADILVHAYASSP